MPVLLCWNTSWLSKHKQTTIKYVYPRCCPAAILLHPLLLYLLPPPVLFPLSLPLLLLVLFSYSSFILILFFSFSPPSYSFRVRSELLFTGYGHCGRPHKVCIQCSDSWDTLLDPHRAPWTFCFVHRSKILVYKWCNLERTHYWYACYTLSQMPDMTYFSLCKGLWVAG